MKNNLLTILALTATLAVNAQTVKSPDGRLAVNLKCENSRISYTASYDGKTVLESSQLGLITDVADFTQGLSVEWFKVDTLKFSYNCRTIKRSSVDVKATHAVWSINR
ncbi:MAG: glycoside hydrolase family 97 N-terminal domain-containing protein, partial [Bacteroidales bacterium]|nr:glycoside hydrolase family 97 N-terminal domain-containing protein [Bacteroidales bacterium]